ncbi:Retrovirus-related Pol polyprotein from transposon TNT 1-94 [Vitis vinifera]|uniref:Retrovirus-related Pol polyprotein from transposon TNT 1-94 n=1 Tax=Vitis vinifera TaxID=29760 RepID=A0A438JFF4_VITVI|nr:Retrovirus-related Pol polyprotein from transposon TNT 1-94 [Vitis vinifera]
MKAEEWALLDRQVLGIIKLTLSRSIVHNVVKENTTTDLMKALSGMYENPSANNKEICRRNAGETSGSGSALNLETRGRGNDRNSNRGRSKSRNSNRNISKSKSGQQVQYWNCEKTADSPLDDWVLNSGSSFHTPPHREIIQNYVAENVRHIPNLRRNLISIGQLDDERHAILFVGGTWKVTKGARVWARRKKTNTLYMTSCPRDTITVANASTDTSIWHHRLGHMSEKGMKMLLSKGKLLVLKSIDFDMCESCILGKQKNVSFLKTGKTSKVEKLELVHTALWGPSPVASLGGSRYYITFIDDSSRNVWVHFLKNKSDVFETFKKWKVMVETETGLKVKCLKSDNKREYIAGGFSEYCVAQGIMIEKTILGTPQQNGVAECMNRTLNERARIPMEFRLPEKVWSGKESKICFFIGYGDEKFGYRDEEDKENVNSQIDLSTLVAEVRRSSRNIRPPPRYSPILNYLLLTDGGEPQCYDKACNMRIQASGS